MLRCLFVVFIAMSVAAGAAMAADPVNYASPDGSGTVCSRAQPCSFSQALATTSTGGTVSLSEGTFRSSQLEINRSVTIQGSGPQTNFSGTYIISIPANIDLVLRDLAIDPSTDVAMQIGIEFAGHSLSLENVIFRDQLAGDAICLKITSAGSALVRIKNVDFSFSGSATGGGIVVAAPSGAKHQISIDGSAFEYITRAIVVQGAGNVDLSISNTTISNSTGHGIFVNPSGGTHKINISDSQIVNNGATGVYVAPTGSAKVDAAVNASSLANNANIGIAALPGGSSSVAVSIADTSVSGNAWGGIYASGKSNFGIIRANIASNGYGITAASPATVRVGSSMINGNYLGLSGPISSYGNNQLLGNTTQGSSTTVPPAGRP